jgi:hypothetical protein
MSRGLLRLIGTVLVLYGLVGIVLLGAIGMTVARPLDDVRNLTQSLADQQSAALESLERTSETIGQTSASVRNAESSLVQAELATARAAELSRGVSVTMYGLAEQMQLTIFGVQPFITLYPSFEQTGQQLDLLGSDVDAIAEALGANREDTIAIADGLDELGRSIDRLRVAMAGGPDVSGTADFLAPMQMGLLALVGWLLAAALLSLLAGLACWLASFRNRRGSIEPTA